jgi:hypothetical protein
LKLEEDLKSEIEIGRFTTAWPEEYNHMQLPTLLVGLTNL